MKRIEEKLRRNNIGRWELGQLELTAGAAVDLKIEDHWISGIIEFWKGDYHWFSRKNGIPVVLHSEIYARLSIQGRYING